MKNTIKKIAVTVSAALMCALPMANAISANAAFEYTTFRTAYFVKWENSSVVSTNITRTTKKGLQTVVRTNMNSDGAFGAINGSGGQTYNHTNVKWNRKSGSFQKKALIYNETYKSSYGGIFEDYLVSDTALKIEAMAANNEQANERIAYEAVVVGDVEGAYETTKFKNFNANGISYKDVDKANSLIRSGKTDIASYAKTVDFENANSVSLRTLRAMMAADVNNNGKVSAADVNAIQAWIDGKTNDLSIFTGLTDAQVNNKINSL